MLNIEHLNVCRVDENSRLKLKLRNCFVLQKKLITRSEEGDTGDTGRDEEIRDNECGLLS